MLALLPLIAVPSDWLVRGLCVLCIACHHCGTMYSRIRNRFDLRTIPVFLFSCVCLVRCRCIFACPIDLCLFRLPLPVHSVPYQLLSFCLHALPYGDDLVVAAQPGPMACRCTLSGVVMGSALPPMVTGRVSRLRHPRPRPRPRPRHGVTSSFTSGCWPSLA